MNKRIFRYLFIVILLIYAFLFFFGNNIFPNQLTLKRDLTIKQIEKFEEDIKNGNKIDINDYVVKKKNYDNVITKTNEKISNIIEEGFKELFKYILRNLDK